MKHIVIAIAVLLLMVAAWAYSETLISDQTEVKVRGQYGIIYEYADTTNIGTGNHFYPSPRGQNVRFFNDAAIEYYLSGGLTMTVQSKINNYWVDITPAGYEVTHNLLGYTYFTDVTGQVDFDNLDTTYLRIKIVAADATNQIRLSARYRMPYIY